jgi:hypothetical protein
MVRFEQACQSAPSMKYLGSWLWRHGTPWNDLGRFGVCNDP